MRFHFRRLLLGAAFTLALPAAGCGPAETTATASLTWQIVDAAAPDPTTAPALACDVKKVAFVRVQLVPGGLFDFPCASMAAQTTTVASGVYTIQVIALNDSYQVLSQKTFQQRLFGQTSLGHIVFQVH